jgi:hypothetical protein
MKIPVMVHHWGHSGASWTIAPILSERYVDIVRALKTLLFYYDRISSVEQVITTDTFILVVTAEPDNNCVDPKAKGRNPFVMKVAFLESANLEEWQDKFTAIFEALKNVTPSPDYDNQDQMFVAI